MNDRHVVALAVATAFGCWFARTVPWPVVGLLAVSTALYGGVWNWVRTALLALTVAALGSSLAAHAWASLDAPLPDEVSGVATVVRDPEDYFGKSRVEVSLAGRHWHVMSNSDTNDVLTNIKAGERVYVSGYTEALSGVAVPSLRRRHVAGRLHATDARYAGAGSLLSRAANRSRDVISGGAQSMSREQRSLFTGLVYGDDREQSDEVVQQFRNAGLAHLTAVSGQNVLFVLLVCSPLLGRLSLLWRFIGGLCVLLFFGTITRWEPSVIRAEAMAVVMLLGAYLGRPVSLWRSLSLAITGSLLADPFLVGSIGFLMSAGACCGMALVGQPLTDRLPGPLWLRRSLGYSTGAQLGVAPVSFAVFGPMPVVALVTNLLAEPAAAAVMCWGVVAGTITGLAGEPVASLLHVPTRLLVDWLAAVARYGSAAPVGGWTAPRIGIGAAVVAVGMWWRRRPARLPSTA